MWGGRLIVVSTHNGADNPFAKLCDDIKAGAKGAASVEQVERPAELPIESLGSRRDPCARTRVFVFRFQRSNFRVQIPADSSERRHQVPG